MSTRLDRTTKTTTATTIGQDGSGVDAAQEGTKLRQPDLPKRSWNIPNPWEELLVGAVKLVGWVLGGLFPSLFGKDKSCAAGGAQVGAACGRSHTKGAVLSGHVQEARNKYFDARKALTSSIAYAEQGGAPATETEFARGALEPFDTRANEIFENLGNRHRSGKSRQNQRANLDALIGEMGDLATRLDEGPKAPGVVEEFFGKPPAFDLDGVIAANLLDAKFVTQKLPGLREKVAGQAKTNGLLGINDPAPTIEEAVAQQPVTILNGVGGGIASKLSGVKTVADFAAADLDTSPFDARTAKSLLSTQATLQTFAQ